MKQLLGKNKTDDMTKGPNKYEDAVRQLEEIVEKIESGEFDIDSLTIQLERAQNLIKICRDRLTKTDEQIKNMLENG